MLPESWVQIFCSHHFHSKELGLSFSPLYLILQTVTMEPCTDACKIYHVWKKTGSKKGNGGYRNWKLPQALTFSVREQHFIRLKSCAEHNHKNEGPKSHRATHCSAFDNVRLSTSQKHSNRNQNARGWDNVASDTRLLTTFDQAPSKTACRCSNQSLRQRQVDPAAVAIAAPAAHTRKDQKVFRRVREAHLWRICCNGHRTS